MLFLLMKLHRNWSNNIHPVMSLHTSSMPSSVATTVFICTRCLFGGLRNFSLFSRIQIQDTHFSGLQTDVGTGFQQLEQVGWIQSLTEIISLPAAMLLPKKLQWLSWNYLALLWKFHHQERAQGLRSLGILSLVDGEEINPVEYWMV